MADEGFFADKDMKCDYCNEDAIFKFRLMRLVRHNSRWARVWSGEWLGGCVSHLDKAMERAKGGIKR